jgi:hypothetical protein
LSISYISTPATDISATTPLNAVENFFSVLTRKRIRRGTFHSIVDLQAAIKRYLAEHNVEPSLAPRTISSPLLPMRLRRWRK